MAKQPPYHMRVTIFVTLTHWTERSPECEVMFHTQHGTGTMRMYGSLHTPMPLTELSDFQISTLVQKMLKERFSDRWREKDWSGGETALPPALDDLET